MNVLWGSGKRFDCRGENSNYSSHFPDGCNNNNNNNNIIITHSTSKTVAKKSCMATIMVEGRGAAAALLFLEGRGGEWMEGGKKVRRGAEDRKHWQLEGRSGGGVLLRGDWNEERYEKQRSRAG